MFLALRELAFSRVRFGLMGAVLALIAVLMVMLSGLSVGLVNDGVSGLQKLPVTSFAFERTIQTDAAFSRSVVDLDAVQTWRTQPGVEDAAPFGNTLVNAKSDRGVEIDLALFGVEPTSFVAPEVSEGSTLSAPYGIVVSTTAIEAGLQVGDTVTLDHTGTKLRVIGVTDGQHTFGHVDVAYLPLSTWQAVKAGAGPGAAVPEAATQEITAVAVRAAAGQSVDLAAGDAAADTQSMSQKDSYGASPGYTAETMTLQLIQGFLYVISALVAAAFFAVWVIQRKHEVAVLRAMGASAGYVLRDALTQAFVLLVVAIGVGAAVGVGLGALVTGSGMPFALDAVAVTAASVGLIVLGLVGAGLAVVRIANVEPATALGGNR